MLCLSGLELYSRWVPLKNVKTLVPLPTYSYDPRGFYKGFFYKNEASEMPAKE